MDMRTKIALVDNKPMGRTTLHWTTVANALAAGLDHGVCDGPTWAAVMAAEIARVEGAKPLPTMANRSESGGFFWEVGNPGDTRPFATGDRGSKAIDKMAGQLEAKLQRRREYDAARYAAMSPAEKEAYIQRQAESRAARIAAMSPEEREALRRRQAESDAARIAAMSPEEKVELRQRQAEYSAAQTSARAEAVPVLPGHFLAGDRLCIFGCGRPAIAADCPACPHDCFENRWPKWWAGCNRTITGLCKVQSHRKPAKVRTVSGHDL